MFLYNTIKRDWYLSGASIQGDIHSRTGLPNQDAIDWLYSGNSDYAVLSVGDGHGSNIHFRSSIGSKIAVMISLRVIDKLFDNQKIENYNIGIIKDTIRFDIPRLLTRNWRAEVLSHLSRYPFDNYEIEMLSKKSGFQAVKKVKSNPEIAYGSTLLIAAITQNFIIFLQIGDGNILIVNDRGKVFDPFVYRDNSNLDKQDTIVSTVFTDSLCSNYSWLKFKADIFNIYDLNPNLILLSTDGYYNSFTNNDNFLKIGIDYLHLFQKYGYMHVMKSLSRILKDTSKRGSGDDITLGIFYKFT